MSDDEGTEAEEFCKRESFSGGWSCCVLLWSRRRAAGVLAILTFSRGSLILDSRSLYE